MEDKIFLEPKKAFLSLATNQAIKGEQYRVIFLLFCTLLKSSNSIHVQLEVRKRLKYNAPRVSKSFALLESIGLIKRIYPEPNYKSLWYYQFYEGFPDRISKTSQESPSDFQLFCDTYSAFEDLATNRTIQGQTFRVLCVLFAHLQPSQGMIEIVPSKIAEILGVRHSAISRHLITLVKLGILVKYSRQFSNISVERYKEYLFLYSLSFKFPHDFERRDPFPRHPFNRKS